MILQAWGDTMVVTAALVLAVLVIRKPFARHFGPQLAYTLWLIPALRLVLPPLPFADPAPAVVSGVPVDAALMEVVDAAEAVGTPVAIPEAIWSFVDALPLLFALWALGFVAVLVSAALAHQRFRAEVLEGSAELEPLGSIRLIMTDAVDGPVAFGLCRRFVAVPHDFFARYATEERALAIDHELSHHRHGDLWANAAALLLLAAQWFNPFAWRAIRAFRFDQEAACDARVLTMVGSGTDTAPRNVRTARYATAIAKAAVGSRLSLAAPMAVHDNLQERLTMLTREDISTKRGLIGKLLVGGAAVAVLATTATLVPAATASAQAELAEPTAPPAPPELPSPPEAPVAPDAPDMMIFTEPHDGDTADKDGKKREVRRIVIHQDGEGEGKSAVMLAPADGKFKRVEIRTPGSLSRDDILATLKEQGIGGAQAEAIADKLEAKRKERLRTAMAPLPPMPAMPPMPAHGAWNSFDGKAMAMGKCGDGSKTAPIVNREEVDGNKRQHIYMIRCGDTAETKAARLSALKKAREGFAKGEAARGLSEEMRAKVAADLDKAIAEIEKSGD